MTRFTGNTVEEAVQAGLESLNIARSQAQITVLSKGKKGFLGFGKQLAEVEIVELKTQPKVSAVPAQTTAEVKEPLQAEPAIEPAPVQEVEEVQPTETSDEQSAEPVAHQNFNDEFEAFMAQEEEEDLDSQEPSQPRPNVEEAAQAVQAYLEKIIYEMDIEAELSAQTSRRQVTLQIDTPEAGRLIGYHGKVLKSLQLVGQNFLHDRFSRNFKLSINVNDYMEYRTEALIELATKIAYRVQETGRDYRMEPMTNTERKIVHKTVAKVSGVESYSEGDDPNRYVVVVNRDKY